MLHFLSREAADEEKKEVEKEVARWKEVVKQRDVKLAQKDEQITELVNQSKSIRVSPIRTGHLICPRRFTAHQRTRSRG